MNNNSTFGTTDLFILCLVLCSLDSGFQPIKSDNFVNEMICTVFCCIARYVYVVLKSVFCLDPVFLLWFFRTRPPVDCCYDMLMFVGTSAFFDCRNGQVANGSVKGASPSHGLGKC